jgi:hypothetical protein
MMPSSLPLANESGYEYEFKGIASIGRLLAGRAKGLVSQRDFLKGKQTHWASGLM